MRALQQPKAVLLEGAEAIHVGGSVGSAGTGTAASCAGPPGLGKTATVQALAKATGRRLSQPRSARVDFGCRTSNHFPFCEILLMRWGIQGCDMV